MGYTTDFVGALELTPPLTPEQVQTFNAVSESEDSQHLPGSPSGYCQWLVSTDGRFIQWDGVEKFYDYIPWMQFLIRRYLAPWGVSASGEIQWAGEDPGDRGVIVVEKNRVGRTRLIAKRAETIWDR